MQVSTWYLVVRLGGAWAGGTGRQGWQEPLVPIRGAFFMQSHPRILPCLLALRLTTSPNCWPASYSNSLGSKRFDHWLPKHLSLGIRLVEA